MFEAWKERLKKTANTEDDVVFKPMAEAPAETPAAPEAPKEETGASIEGNNIAFRVVRPEGMEDIFTIADHLLDGYTVVLNLELLDKVAITRMLDFLNGVTYVTGGEVKNVSQGTYLITPSGINLNE